MLTGYPAVYIIKQASLPVLPVGNYGTTDDFLSHAVRGKRPRIEMKNGAPLSFQPIHELGEARCFEKQAHADQIMFPIAELLPHK